MRSLENRFPRVYGNAATVKRLSDAVLSDTLSHAMLIVGPEGSGRHTLATELAAAVNCERRGTVGVALPCGACKNCRRVYSRSFPDVSYLEREAGKATLGTNEVREFREQMFLSSSEAEHRIYVIDEAELLTPQAQNALLKVFEEPPANVHIILITKDTDTILSTIKSRAQLIQTEIFDTENTVRLMCRISDTARALAASDPMRLRAIALSSGGVIGKALSRLDERQMAIADQTRALALGVVGALSRKVPFSRIYEALSALPDKRNEVRAVLEEIVVAVCDMLCYKKSESRSPLFFLTKEECEAAAEAISPRRLAAIYDILASAIADVDKNVLIAPLLTDIAVRISEA